MSFPLKEPQHSINNHTDPEIHEQPEIEALWMVLRNRGQVWREHKIQDVAHHYCNQRLEEIGRQDFWRHTVLDTAHPVRVTCKAQLV